MRGGDTVFKTAAINHSPFLRAVFPKNTEHSTYCRGSDARIERAVDGAHADALVHLVAVPTRVHDPQVFEGEIVEGNSHGARDFGRLRELHLDTELHPR